jgi:hypothetical protein
MGNPELIVDGEDQYKRLAEQVNAFRSAAVPVGLDEEDQQDIAEYQNAIEAATGQRPSTDETVEKLGLSGKVQVSQRRAKVATSAEMAQWVSEITRQVQESLLSSGLSAASVSVLEVQIQTDIASSLLSGAGRGRVDPRFANVTRFPLWMQLARTLAFEESDSARLIPGSLLFTDRRREITSGLAGQGIITEAERVAFNGEPGADPALATQALQFNEEMRTLVPDFMRLARGVQRPRGALTTGNLAALTQSVITNTSPEDIQAGLLPLPASVLEREPDIRGGTRDKALAKALLKDDETLSRVKALEIANLLLGVDLDPATGEPRKVIRKSFITDVKNRGRSEAQAIEEWKAFDVAREDLASAIETASRDTEGMFSEEAAVFVVDAAERGVQNIDQAVQANRVGAQQAATAKELDEGTLDDDIRRLTGKWQTIEDFDEDSLRRLRADKDQRRLTQEDIVRELDATRQRKAKDRSLAVKVDDLSEGHVQLTDLDEESQRQLRVDEKKRVLTDEDVLQALTATREREAATAQGKANVIAVSDLEIERTLEDMGIGSAASNNDFQQYLRRTVIRQLREVLEDQRRLNPTAPLDIKGIIRGHFGEEAAAPVDQALAPGATVPPVPLAELGREDLPVTAETLDGLEAGAAPGAAAASAMPRRFQTGEEAAEEAFGVPPLEHLSGAPAATAGLGREDLPVIAETFDRLELKPSVSDDEDAKDRRIRREIEAQQEAERQRFDPLRPPSGPVPAFRIGGPQELPTEFPSNLELAQLVKESTGGDVDFQRFVLGNLESLAGEFHTFTQEEADRREREAAERFSIHIGPEGKEIPPLGPEVDPFSLRVEEAFRAIQRQKDFVPFGIDEDPDRVAEEYRSGSDEEEIRRAAIEAERFLGFYTPETQAILKQKAAQRTPFADLSPRIRQDIARRAAAPETQRFGPFVQSKLPEQRALFEATPGFSERQQEAEAARERTAEAEGRRREQESLLKKRKALTRRGRTVFTGLV